MKKINSYTFLIASILMIFSCSSDDVTEKNKVKKELPLIETVNGMYTEYYPGRKAVKIQGMLDGNKLRNGKWVFKSEKGDELSVTNYRNGKKNGFSIVKFPNGSIHYYGEYRNDEKIGVWKTYSPEGKVIEEKDFGGF